jgi:hypothetical protein
MARSSESTIAGESKAEAFKRLASQRTNAVLERLRILGNCANRGLYDYSEEDVRRIFGAIEGELKLTKAKFTAGKKRKFEL